MRRIAYGDTDTEPCRVRFHVDIGANANRSTQHHPAVSAPTASECTARDTGRSNRAPWGRGACTTVSPALPRGPSEMLFLSEKSNPGEADMEFPTGNLFHYFCNLYIVKRAPRAHYSSLDYISIFLKGNKSVVLQRTSPSFRHHSRSVGPLL
jgi:hypothetical protein